MSDPPTPNLLIFSPVQSSGIALSSILPAAGAFEIVLPCRRLVLVIEPCHRYMTVAMAIYNAEAEAIVTIIIQP